MKFVFSDAGTDHSVKGRSVVLFFFFQAEDGIRDYKVTGVQTCALPISALASGSRPQSRRDPGRISRRPGRTPDRAAPAPRLREAAPEPLRLDLEQRLDRGKAGKAMPPQTAEAHAGRRRRPDRDPGPGGHHDLPAVSRRADASRGVNRQPDVPDLGERGASAVNPHPDPDVEIVGPPALAE